MFCLVIDLPPDLLPKIYCISTQQGPANSFALMEHVNYIRLFLSCNLTY